MDKRSGRTVARVAVDRSQGGPWTLLQLQALGGGHVAGSPCLGLRVGAGPGGQAGVASGAGRGQGGRALCLGLLGVFSRGVPTGTCRRERSDGKGGSLR